MRAHWCLLVSLVLAPPLSAQASTVIHLPHKTIEVVGLEHWTVQMIQDSMDRYSPGDSLQSHACAAILRYKLHFADASATTTRKTPTDSTEYVFVGVVEPEDSARVAYRPMALNTDTAIVRPAWRAVVGLIRHHPAGFQAGLQFYPMRGNARVAAGILRMDSAGVAGIWRFLEAHASRAEMALARTTLKADSSIYDRMIAAAMLVNAPDNDSTWWSLMETLREPDGAAKATAGQVLGVLSRRDARRIDWAPEEKTIHAILDGTDLFELPSVMRVLVKTGVSPGMAAPLLKDGGHAVLAYAGAQLPAVRQPALALLEALRGKDLGANVGVWRAWVNSL